MTSYEWYGQLVKPSWAPPAWVFGPVWTVLYILIAVSFGAVFLLTIKKKLPASLAIPFILNLVFNFAFTPLQFGLRNNILAGLDIILVLITLMWALKAIKPHKRWIFFANLPYLLWVLFATALQLTVTFLNW